MKTITTYIARSTIINGQTGFADSQAAADEINKNLSASGDASFTTGDERAEYRAYSAMQSELDSCNSAIREFLFVDAVVCGFDE